MGQKSVYFPNLNGLRFIAAFMVIIQHTEQFKAMLNLDNCFKTSPFIGVAGKLGVILFFVLSGFLISYLLFQEEKSNGKIEIRKFYIRRLLRIWPLYYLIILLAFFLFPEFGKLTFSRFGKELIHDDISLKLGVYLLFFPNLIFSFSIFIPYASHLWSIGTEEQFYLLWPLLMKKLRNHKFLLLISVIVGYNFVRILLADNLLFDFPGQMEIREYWAHFNIDCMAIGGLFALLLFQNSRFLQILKSDLLFFTFLFLVICMLGFGLYIPLLHNQIYAVLFGVIILNLASRKKMIISLENPVMNYLGKISYGLYMYHPVAIGLVMVFSFQTGWFNPLLIQALSLGVTVLIADLSFRFFESFFLRFKSRFTIIRSGQTDT